MRKSFCQRFSADCVVRVFLWAVLLHGGIGFAADSAPKGKIQIQTFTNREPTYTIYGFWVEAEGVRIEWEVVDRVGHPQKYLRLYSRHAASFATNLPVHKAIMAKIFATWPIQEFDGFFSGCLGAPPDWSWSVAIAIASSKSADYQDYRRNYPNSRIKGLNGLYRTLAVESKAYHPLQDVFKEFGATIELTSGEKVMTSRAEKLPFYPQLRAAGISGKTTVLYDASGNGFTMKPWQTNSAPVSKK